jgi:DNA-binding transcriptional LysR family regulator
MRPVIRQRSGEADVETIVLPAFMLLPFFVENTNITAVIQRRLIERLQPAVHVRTFTLDYPMPKISMFAAWNRARSGDPMHRWVRNMLVEIGAGLVAEATDFN